MSGQKILSFFQIYYLHNEHISVGLWYLHYAKSKSYKTEKIFCPDIYTSNIGIHRLLHDIPRLLILFPGQFSFQL